MTGMGSPRTGMGPCLEFLILKVIVRQLLQLNQN